MSCVALLVAVLCPPHPHCGGQSAPSPADAHVHAAVAAAAAVAVAAVAVVLDVHYLHSGTAAAVPTCHQYAAAAVSGQVYVYQ